MYNNDLVKMIDYIYEDFVSTGNFCDSKEYCDLIDKVNDTIKDEKVNELAHKYSFAASRQFFVLGFLKATEIFDLNFENARK